jgi:hypothetical protein
MPTDMAIKNMHLGIWVGTFGIKLVRDVAPMIFSGAVPGAEQGA